jgi:exodeoxyribonuclease V alpha subunit
MSRLSTARENEWRNQALAAASAGDSAPMLVFADWLEENDRPDEAAAIRDHYVAGIAPKPVSLWPSALTLEDVSEHQRAALYRALCRPVGILTGSPGVGKTTCIAAVVRGLLAAGRHDIAVCAPTGRAAVRCTQALRDRGVVSDHLVARTVHQTLGVVRGGGDGGGWVFNYTAHRPLPVRFVILDEASMLSTSLAADLFTALAPGTHVLLVGDAGQLPPVEHGSPLRDLAAGGVPAGELTEIHRNAGLIVRACVEIRQGRAFETCERFDPGAGANLRHVEAATPGGQLEALLGILRRFGESGTFDPVNDVQVITALNTKSEVAREPLNRLLQSALNPAAQAPVLAGGGDIYRVGDKVICLRNHWTAGGRPWDGAGRDDDDRGAARTYLANGEMGIVTATQHGIVEAAFEDPPRTVRTAAPRGIYGAVFNRPPRTVRFATRRERETADGGRREEDNTDFALGFAITVHKAQGAQWPCVIVMIDASAGAARVACREHWYTALSRAERLCITIGQKKVMFRQARKPALERRKTFLTRLLLGEGSR